MNNTMEYKGYVGSVELSEAGCSGSDHREYHIESFCWIHRNGVVTIIYTGFTWTVICLMEGCSRSIFLWMVSAMMLPWRMVLVPSTPMVRST